MQTLTSRPIELKKDIHTIYGMLSNPASLSPLLEKYREKIPAKNILLEQDQISVDTGVFGEIILKQDKAMAPNLIQYSSVKSPMPVKLSINLSEDEENKTLGQFSLDFSVPPFLSGMIKSKAEPIMNEVANVLEKLDLDEIVGFIKK